MYALLKSRELSKYPLVEGRLKTLRHIHAVEYYAASKKHRNFLHVFGVSWYRFRLPGWLFFKNKNIVICVCKLKTAAKIIEKATSPTSHSDGPWKVIWNGLLYFHGLLSCFNLLQWTCIANILKTWYASTSLCMWKIKDTRTKATELGIKLPTVAWMQKANTLRN